MAFIHRPIGYGALAKAAHWGTACLIVAMFALAWTFVRMDEGAGKAVLVTVHESIGIIILLIALGRILGRWMTPFPAFSSTVTPLERYLARTVQLSLYAALLLVPLSGWVFANAFGDAVSFFGMFMVPQLAEKDIPLRNLAWMVHQNGGYVILGLVALHVAGALRHHFLKRDDVLRRMLPSRAGPSL
ncbi:MAG: cytochrome b [Pseudolabrys sp.]|nr:cytochrome b [Pseudolabrys sp.]